MAKLVLFIWTGTIIADGIINNTATVVTPGTYSDIWGTWSYDISAYPNATVDNFVVEFTQILFKTNGLPTENMGTLRKTISNGKLIVGISNSSGMCYFGKYNTKCKVVYIT